MSVTCPQCSEQNQDEAKMCGMCGALIQQKTAVAPTSIPPSPIPVQQPMMPPQMRGAGSNARSYVEYAGFWSRFAASFVDGILLIILNFIIGLVIGVIYGVMAGAAGASRDSIRENAQILGYVVGTVVGWLYYALMESSDAQGTFAKQWFGIKVTDLNGDRISFGQATGRHFGKIISGLILFIGYIMAGFTEKKQALHDMMASCLVVRR